MYMLEIIDFVISEMEYKLYWAEKELEKDDWVDNE